MKMRAAVFIILTVAFTALVASSPASENRRFPAPYSNRLPPPRPRFRRSPEPQPGPQGSLSATWWRDISSSELRPFYNELDYDHGVFENRFRRSAENESSESKPESSGETEERLDKIPVGTQVDRSAEDESSESKPESPESSGEIEERLDKIPVGTRVGRSAEYES